MPKEELNPIEAKLEEAKKLSPTDLLDSFKDLISDERGRRLFLRMLQTAKLENIRPIAWSKASNATYYRKRYAEELKEVIDAMILDSEDRLLRFTSFPQLSKKSLYIKVNQSFLYLVNEMDTEDSRYRTAKENICITRESEGVRLSWAKSTDSISNAEIVKPKQEEKTWKIQLDKFLEDGKPNTKLHISGLMLTDEEVTDVVTSLNQLKNVVHIITRAEIKVVKLDTSV